MEASMILPESAVNDLATIRDRRSRRVSSWDRSGGNFDCITLAPGETRRLAEIDGPAVIRHFYVTAASGDRSFYRTCILRMYWDHETTPSVEAPLGDFFGIVHAKPRCFASLMMTVNPGTTTVPGGGTHGLNCYFPMPFATHARIEIENQGEIGLFGFWYHIDYEEMPALPENQGRFHAQWRRENPTQPPAQTRTNLTDDDNYVLLEAEGRGHYVGCMLGVDNVAGGWYGEGDDMIFVDGEAWPPSIHGTGTEEVFGGGACPTTEYAGPYTGFHLISNPDWAGKSAMYRWCITDPVRFTQSLRVTLEHGHANDFANDYCSVAYWYQTEPHAPFPPLPDGAGLLPRRMQGFDQIRDREAVLIRWMGECFRRGRTLYFAPDQCRAEALGAELNRAVDREDLPGALSALDALFKLSQVDEGF